MESLGQGHINQTWRVTPSAGKPCVLQCVNGTVFGKPEQIMTNMGHVGAYFKQLKQAGQLPLPDFLQLLPAQDGRFFFKDSQHHYWRLMPLVEGIALQEVQHAGQAFAAARAFAQFQRALAGYDGPVLHEVLPRFHDVPFRMTQLREAVVADKVGRLDKARSWVDWALKQDELADTLLGAYRAGKMPMRITHNDAKINNLMFDPTGTTPVCVVDLDTLMPGLGLYDLGDLIRTATCRAPEDCAELSQMVPDPVLVKAVLQGWREGYAGQMTATEEALMLMSGVAITFIMGIRFLADYLKGDIYYKVAHPEHNLQRAAAQLTLAKNLWQSHDELMASSEGPSPRTFLGEVS